MNLKEQYNKTLNKANKQEEWLDGKRGDEVDNKYIEAYRKTIDELNDILIKIKETGEEVTRENIINGF